MIRNGKLSMSKNKDNGKKKTDDISKFLGKKYGEDDKKTFFLKEGSASLELDKLINPHKYADTASGYLAKIIHDDRDKFLDACQPLTAKKYYTDRIKPLESLSSLSFMKASEKLKNTTLELVNIQDGIAKDLYQHSTLVKAPEPYSASYYLEKTTRKYREKYLTDKAESLRHKATPIMSIWKICMMLLPPPFLDGDRREFALGIFSAIEKWGMEVFTYPQRLKHPAFLAHFPYRTKLKTKVHIDHLENFALAGKVTPDAPLLVSLWREYIAKHENRIIIPQLENLPKIRKIKSRKKTAKNRHAEWLDRAIWLWDNWDNCSETHSFERRGKDKIFKIIASEFSCSRTGVYKAISKAFDKHAKRK